MILHGSLVAPSKLLTQFLSSVCCATPGLMIFYHQKNNSIDPGVSVGLFLAEKRGGGKQVRQRKVPNDAIHQRREDRNFAKQEILKGHNTQLNQTAYPFLLRSSASFSSIFRA